MNNIHKTAVIGPDVTLGQDVTVSPYAVLDGRVTLGDGCVIGPFVHITGNVTIGKSVRIHSGAALGEPPQDVTWDGAPGPVTIGDGCVLREGVTVHTPIHGDKDGSTAVGPNCFLMANSHVAHNVKMGEGVILANGCLLAGFVEVGEYAFLSGNVAVHQFCRIGAYTMTGGVCKIVQDLPHYMLADGSPALVHGLNVVGLRRRGFNAEQRNSIKEAYRILYSGRSRQDIVAKLEQNFRDRDYVLRLADFLKSSKRGIVGHHGETE